jgi:hypothetical protein
MEPLSYTELLSAGALDPSPRGLTKLVAIATYIGDRERPRWELQGGRLAWGHFQESLEKAKEAQQASSSWDRCWWSWGCCRRKAGTVGVAAATARLAFDRERMWFELLRAGYTLADLRAVILYLQREIRAQRRNVGALKLSNLLQPDRFEEDLQICRVRVRACPPPAPPPPPPAPPLSPEQAQQGRQRALQCLQQIKAVLR